MFSATSDRYIQLLQNFPPRPIKSEDDFLAVQNVIDTILDSNQITQEQQDYLNVLGMLVYEYEEKQISIPDLSGVDLLKALIDELGLKQKDLVPIFKTESIAIVSIDTLYRRKAEGRGLEAGGSKEENIIFALCQKGSKPLNLFIVFLFEI